MNDTHTGAETSPRDKEVWSVGNSCWRPKRGQVLLYLVQDSLHTGKFVENFRALRAQAYFESNFGKS